MRLLLLAAALACLPRPAAAQSVASVDGRIVYTAADGTRRALTRCGGDVEPALSPDGETVVFVRLPGPLPPDTAGPLALRVDTRPRPGDPCLPAPRGPLPLTEAARRWTQLWAVRVDSGEERPLSWFIPVSFERPRLYARPRFPSAANVVHYTADEGGRTWALDLDAETGGPLPRNGIVEIVRAGPLAGHLVVRERVIRVNGTAERRLALYDPAGRFVREITEGIEAFRAAHAPR